MQFRWAKQDRQIRQSNHREILVFFFFFADPLELCSFNNPGVFYLIFGYQCIPQPHKHRVAPVSLDTIFEAKQGTIMSKEMRVQGVYGT